jgi:hypothetical protein
MSKETNVIVIAIIIMDGAYADYMATISFREGVNEKQKNNYIIGYLTFSDEKVVP